MDTFKILGCFNIAAHTLPSLRLNSFNLPNRLKTLHFMGIIARIVARYRKLVKRFHTKSTSIITIIRRYTIKDGPELKKVAIRTNPNDIVYNLKTMARNGKSNEDNNERNTTVSKMVEFLIIVICNEKLKSFIRSKLKTTTKNAKEAKMESIFNHLSNQS